MAKIPDNYIDFICADFPYNISWNGGLTMKGDKIVKADFWEWDKWDSQEDYLDFVFKVCTEYRRILKPNGSLILFFSYRLAGWIAYELETRGLFTFRTPIILNKKNPQPHYRKTGFRSCYEMGMWLVNDGGKFSPPKTFNFLSQKEMTNVQHYLIGKEGNKQSSHPTEKPIDIISKFIEIFTNKGDVVLDNFAWSWTTGIAAYKLERNAISIEQDPKFIKMIHARQNKL